MSTGTVVRFDTQRGYGFIAPSEGSEDVFLHVNDLLIPEHEIRAGITVVFDAVEGERGLKAERVRLPEGDTHIAAVAGTPTPKPANLRVAPLNTDTPPTQSPALEEDDEQLTEEYVKEFSAGITEILLVAEPPLIGSQILRIRNAMLEFVREWLSAE